jgi:predicted transcriptional regulator YdeE
MDTITFNSDINLFYISATSFPDGIMDAHQKLHTLVPFSTERKFFGISRPENGVIAYKAAAEELTPGEAEKLNLDTLVLKKGNYVSLTIHNYLEDIPAIDKAFKELLPHPRLDPNGYCVEWYLNDKDVKCMIRLND